MGGLLAVVLVFVGPPEQVDRLPRSPPPPRLDRMQLRASVEDREELPKLEKQADGSYTYRDRRARIMATIRKDGSVRFRDLPQIELRADLGQRWRSSFGEALLRPRGQRGRADLEQPRVGGVEAGMETLPYGWRAAPAPGVGLTCKIGSARIDRMSPVRTKAKADFLRRTATLRARMRQAFATAAEKRSLLKLGPQLSAIWQAEDKSIVDKKRTIFELWDGITDESKGDNVRERVERFIRRTAPKGSKDAFTADELRRFNSGRRSKVRFAPYDVS